MKKVIREKNKHAKHYICFFQPENTTLHCCLAESGYGFEWLQQA